MTAGSPHMQCPCIRALREEEDLSPGQGRAGRGSGLSHRPHQVCPIHSRRPQEGAGDGAGWTSWEGGKERRSPTLQGLQNGIPGPLSPEATEEAAGRPWGLEVVLALGVSSAPPTRGPGWPRASVEKARLSDGTRSPVSRGPGELLTALALTGMRPGARRGCCENRPPSPLTTTHDHDSQDLP